MTLIYYAVPASRNISVDQRVVLDRYGKPLDLVINWRQF